MKTTRLALLVAASFLAYAPMASAAEGTTIAVVNIQQIMRESTAAKSVREQLESKQKSFQSEISKKEEGLQKDEQALAKQRGVLAKDAFEKKVAEFRKRATEVQKEVQSKKSLLDSSFERALGEIQKSVTEVIADLSKEKGFQVAVPTSQILYADSKLDITPDVMSALNKKLSKVEVKFEAPAAKDKK